MASSAESAAPDVADSIDESAVEPSPRVYGPPLVPDRMRFQVTVPPVSIETEVHVNGGLHAATNYAVVCGVALAVGVVAFLLCSLAGASGWIVLGVAPGAFILVLILGLAATGPRRESSAAPTIR
ncbi:hypothetical protein GCM10023322_16850 [Rugosimonospora acidiphila]|uniref:Uncharacterized protein n=1 Tax=Rugosimonospora acidiphila TaxID=556531 RepID=A0ABP9RPJ0_9ACTN